MLLQRFKKPDQRYASQKPCQKTQHYRNPTQALHQEESHRIHAINLLKKIINLQIKSSLSPLTGKKTKHHTWGKEACRISKIGLSIKIAQPIGKEEPNWVREVKIEAWEGEEKRGTLKLIEEAESIAEGDGLKAQEDLRREKGPIDQEKELKKHQIHLRKSPIYPSNNLKVWVSELKIQ